MAGVEGVIDAHVLRQLLAQVVLLLPLCLECLQSLLQLPFRDLLKPDGILQLAVEVLSLLLEALDFMLEALKFHLGNTNTPVSRDVAAPLRLTNQDSARRLPPNHKGQGDPQNKMPPCRRGQWPQPRPPHIRRHGGNALAAGSHGSHQIPILLLKISTSVH